MLSLLFSMMAITVSAADVVLKPNYTGDDIEQLFKSSGIAPKSEFETTAQYEARLNAARISGKRLVLLLDDVREQTFKYDADAGMMTATIPTSRVRFLSEPNYPTHTVIRVHKSERRDEYVGQNAYGAERHISRTRGDEYGVVISQSFNRPLVFPLDSTAAREAKPYLHLGFACTILDDKPLKDLTYHEPTISEPYDLAINEHYLPVSIGEVFVFDARTGVALLRFHPDDSTDAHIQSQTRQKLYALELEIRNGLGIYAQVDDRAEEMVFGSLVQARQRIRLRLTSQYETPTFLLNGSPYTPSWRIVNKEYGSFSMFDHAEAVINTESQKPVNSIGEHKVGESYAEWSLHIGIDQKGLCKSNKPACKRLGSIEKNGSGVFLTYDSTGASIAWTFADHKVIGIVPQ
jgi:hypothetical protein